MNSNTPQLEVAVLIATEDQQIVLVRYGWGSAAGNWGLPRTILALNETLAEAVQRLGQAFLGFDVFSGGLITIRELLPSQDNDPHATSPSQQFHRVRLVYEGVLLAPLSELQEELEIPTHISHDTATEPQKEHPGPVEVAVVPLDEVTTYRLESDVLDVVEELGLTINEVQVLPPLEP